MSSFRGILAAACVLSLVPVPARPAPGVLVEQHAANGTVTREALPPGHGLAQIIGNGRVLRSRAIDPSAPLRVIVEFRAEPAVTARRLGLDATLPARSLVRLRNDLARLASGSGAGAPRVTYEYTQVFSGAAVVTLAPALLDRVRSLAYVRRVVPDDSVRAVLEQSVPLIGADRVRSQLGGTGAGIRVGIIDTGIDYHHDAFGNGFGPGHRVAGGWDVVNNDPDPMDDHGHGTHVAGIVAGNGGGVVGVATQATLYAFKVLDANGSGYESGVIAGLERALDPDQNPSTADGMQVVNMSIGGGDGSADNPLSLAVDHLTEAGVVCAVAAGNTPWFFGINSPGSSRRAITVGASTKNDTIAWFSSRGPVPGGFEIKPDLVAPGYDIVSAALGGGKVSLSGTSMATPHVAGVVAQILQLHPQWTPEIVKAAIVGTARSLARSPLIQGSGRLDAFRAATATFAVSPTSLSFGLCDSEVPTWSVTDTLHVTNLTLGPRTVSFQTSGFPNAGAGLQLTPSEVTVPEGGTVDVEVRIQVDNATTVFPHDAPYDFDATVIATAGAESHRIPATFHKAATLTVTAPSGIEWLIVHDRTFGGFLTSVSGSAPILMPPGNYDVMAAVGFLNWTFVVREHLDVHGRQQLALDRSEATAQIDFDNVGPDGNRLDANSCSLSLYDTRTGWGFNYIGFPINQVRVSPVGNTYRLEWTRSDTDHRTRTVSVSGGLTGVSSSQTFSNRPEDLHHVAIHLPAPAAPSGPIIWEFSPFRFEPDGYFGLGYFDTTQEPTTTPFDYDLWFMPSPWEGHVQLATRIDMYEWQLGWDYLKFEAGTEIGPTLRLDRGWPIEGYHSLLWLPRSFTFGGEDLRLGEGIPVWRGRFVNAQQTMALDSGPWEASHLFTDMYGSVFREPDPAFTLRSATVIQDTLRGGGGLQTWYPILQQIPTAGSYEFQTSRAYTLRGRPARLEVNARMDTRLSDPNPPWLYSLQLFADGAAVDSIDFGAVQDAGLRFRLVETDTMPMPAVSARFNGAWVPLPVTRTAHNALGVGDDFLARFPNSLQGPIGLRITTVDRAGNSLQLTWDLAFLAVPGFGRGGPTLALAGAWPNPAPVGPLLVHFTLSGTAPATLGLFDVTGREVVTHDVGSLGPGDHIYDVAAGRALRSGIYFLRLEQGGHVVTSRACVIR